MERERELETLQTVKRQFIATERVNVLIKYSHLIL